MMDEESGNSDTMKPLKASPIQVRRQYDVTFKREAVANWLSSGKSAEVVALELGLSANRLYAWRNLLDPAAARGGRVAVGSRAGTATDLQSELAAAQRENRHLREQRDILKKTLGILSEPSPNALLGCRR
jgi:transposase-like protein